LLCSTRGVLEGGVQQVEEAMCRPFGTRLIGLIFPGTPVPGYWLCRPRSTSSGQAASLQHSSRQCRPQACDSTSPSTNNKWVAQVSLLRPGFPAWAHLRRETPVSKARPGPPTYYSPRHFAEALAVPKALRGGWLGLPRCSAARRLCWDCGFFGSHGHSDFFRLPGRLENAVYAVPALRHAD
jgi:hypothetical protein